MAYCKILHKEGEPKATTAIHGPLGPVFYPNEKANIIANYLENLFTPHSVTLTMNGEWRLESKLCSTTVVKTPHLNFDHVTSQKKSDT
jgi:hypothetical protein